MIKVRNGKSLKTTIKSTYTISEFHEIDNLDTKSLDEAADNYEKTFITIRDYLEEMKEGQYNLASESTRLTIAQNISDLLRKNRLIRKEK